MYRYGFPHIGRSDVIVLMPVEIADNPDGGAKVIADVGRADRRGNRRLASEMISSARVTA